MICLAGGSNICAVIENRLMPSAQTVENSAALWYMLFYFEIIILFPVYITLTRANIYLGDDGCLNKTSIKVLAS